MIEIRQGPKGLSEDIVRFISAKKNRAGMDAGLAAGGLSALADHARADLGAGRLSRRSITRIYYYYSAPKRKKTASALCSTRSDPEILATYAKLGIPLHASRRCWPVSCVPKASGAVTSTRCSDSVSVATTFQAELKKAGVIFNCTDLGGAAPASRLGEEVSRHRGADLGQLLRHPGTRRCSPDGSFVYVPPGVRCPMELSTYFRINEKDTGQFERTLIIADKGACM